MMSRGRALILVWLARSELNHVRFSPVTEQRTWSPKATLWGCASFLPSVEVRLCRRLQVCRLFATPKSDTNFQASVLNPNAGVAVSRKFWILLRMVGFQSQRAVTHYRTGEHFAYYIDWNATSVRQLSNAVGTQTKMSIEMDSKIYHMLFRTSRPQGRIQVIWKTYKGTETVAFFY